MKDQLPGCARCLDLLGDALEADSLFFQLGDDVHEVGQTAAKPIQPPHHQRVTGAQCFQTVVKLRSASSLAVCGLFVDGLNSRDVQRVALQIQVLVICRNSGVADPLIHGQLPDDEKMTGILTGQRPFRQLFGVVFRRRLH